MILTSVLVFGLVVVIVTLCITAWYFKMRLAGTPYHGSPPARVRQAAMVSGVVIGEWLTVWICWLCFRRAASFGSLFQTRTNSLWRDLGIGTVIAGFFIFLAALMRQDVEPMPVLYVILLSLTAGVCEELLFRGFLISLIASAGWGWMMKILLTCVAFGLGHIYMGLGSAAWAMLIGIGFAAVTLWRRNIWAAATAHFLIDLCVLLRLFSMG